MTDTKRLAEIREWIATPGTITERMPRGVDDREEDVFALLRLLDTTRSERDAALARVGVIEKAPAVMALHAYVPHREYPWFCEHCGYSEHERLKHLPRAALTSPDYPPKQPL